MALKFHDMSIISDSFLLICTIVIYFNSYLEYMHPKTPKYCMDYRRKPKFSVQNIKINITILLQ